MSAVEGWARVPREAELRIMGVHDVRDVAKERGVISPQKYRKEELIDMIVGRAYIPKRKKPGRRPRSEITDPVAPAADNTPHAGGADGAAVATVSGARATELAAGRRTAVAAGMSPAGAGRPLAQRRQSSSMVPSDRRGRIVDTEAPNFQAQQNAALDTLASVLPSRSMGNIVIPEAQRPARRIRDNSTRDSLSRSGYRGPAAETPGAAYPAEQSAASSPGALSDITLPPSVGLENAREAESLSYPAEKRVLRGRKRKAVEEEEESFEDLDPSQLIPIAGILDIRDNCAFIRTAGYYAGEADIYVSLSQVKKYRLRKGDAVNGNIRQPRESELGRQRHLPLVSVSLVNGYELKEVEVRPQLEQKLALEPHSRLLAVDSTAGASRRALDLLAPLAKGQRRLIVGPHRSGRTTLMLQTTQSIQERNPDLHIMTLLVGGRPEEAVALERSLQGEVISVSVESSPEEQVGVAELALERAKRLVELGNDVLLGADSLTQLGRAYAFVGAVSSRLVGSVVELAALRPLSRFFLSGRQLEGSGSLTIIGTALSGSVSAIDRLIAYELEAVANAQVTLDETRARQRSFPALDPLLTGSRNEEGLLSGSERAEARRLRSL